MPRRRAITFDFHDTLATCDQWFELEVRTLPAEVVGRLPSEHRTGGPLPTVEVITSTYRELRGEIIGHGVEMNAVAGVVETLRRLGVSAGQGWIARIIDDLMRETLNDVRAKPGAVETVTSLHEAGFALGIVSSAVYHPFLIWVLERFAILPMFQTIVTSASTGFYKSRPEIYQHALRNLDVSAAETCHVGDNPRWDHLMAKSLGMRTVLVSPKGWERSQVAPDLHIHSLVDAAPSIAAIAGSTTAVTPVVQ